MKNFFPLESKSKIFDCTIRDGGVASSSHFDMGFVHALYKANVVAGTDVMELGYKNSPTIMSPEAYGVWRFCPEEVLREIVDSSKLKISLMMDVGKCDINELPPKDKSVVDIIRVAFYYNARASAIELAKAAKNKGYKVALCMMAVSTLSDYELDCALEDFAKCDADIVYLMDSFGALVPMRTRELLAKYVSAMRECQKEVGAHFHNNMQCAFANSIEAVLAGVDYVDATLAGLGKASGNCLLEMLTWAIRGKERARALLDVSQEYLPKLRSNIEWGYSLAYMLSALENVNPKNSENIYKSFME